MAVRERRAGVSGEMGRGIDSRHSIQVPTLQRKSTNLYPKTKTSGLNGLASGQDTWKGKETTSLPPASARVTVPPDPIHDGPCVAYVSMSEKRPPNLSGTRTLAKERESFFIEGREACCLSELGLLRVGRVRKFGNGRASPLVLQVRRMGSCVGRSSWPTERMWCENRGRSS